MKIALLGAPSLSHNVKMVLYHLIEIIDDKEVYLFTGKIKNSKTRKYLKKRCKLVEIRAEYNILNNLLWVCRCILWLIKNDVDVKYVINSSRDASIGSSLAIVSAIYGIKNVFRVVGDCERYKINRGILKFVYWIRYNGIVIISAYFSWKVQVLGPKYYTYLKQWGVPTHKINILPQPIGLHLNEKENKRKEINSKYTCLFVGRMERLKGVNILCKIIDSVLEKSSKYEFWLVGDGKMKNKVEKKYENKNVKCIGNVSHEKISYFYANADLFIFPSKTEGLPTVILEALYFELPIAASDVGEIGHYVNHTFDETEKFVEYIVGEKWKMNRMRRPEFLKWDIMKANYEEFLEID